MPPTAVVIEDEPDIRALIVSVLESCGYTVHESGSGLDGVELVREFAPDVITLDVSLPGIDGFEAARRIREFSQSYIIFISAFVQSGDAERGRTAGGDEYLGKPFRPRELRARLAALTLARSVEAEPSASAGPLSFAQVCLADDALRVVDTAVQTTPSERAVARALILARSRGVAKTELATAFRDAAAPGAGGASDVSSVELFVARLRERLRELGSASTIESQRGEGYRLVERP